MCVCECACARVRAHARLMDLSLDCSSITFSAGRRRWSAAAVTDLWLINQSAAAAAAHACTL